MKYVHVVIGSNYGDEGKGLITHYLSKQAKGNVLNVLYNGGVQRGHTVNKHVFHCFGSGTFDFAATYYREDFFVDPIGWQIESCILGSYPLLYVNPMCRVVTPYDKEVNRALEKSRGKNNHGSCGMGIYEARLRSKDYPIFTQDLENPHKLYNLLRVIKEEYVPHRCAQLNIPCGEIQSIPIDRIMTCSCEFSKNMKITTNTVYGEFDTIVYEGGQGLLLSEDNVADYPHLTPSLTGSQVISKEINAMDDANVSVHYITRPYMTRHGAGPFPTECDKAIINPSMVDKTNRSNEFQQNLRYGWLDISSLNQRINNDLKYYKHPVQTRLAITQLNVTNGKIVSGLSKRSTVSELAIQNRKIDCFYNECF